MYITSGEGSEKLVEKYNSNKIFRALKLAVMKVEGVTDTDLFGIVREVTLKVRDLGVEELELKSLEEIIYSVLEDTSPALLQSYKSYRKKRERLSIEKSDFMKYIKLVGKNTDRDNANVGNNFSAKLLRIASYTNKLQNLTSMPKALAKLHEEGDLYYHDLDSYNLTSNCLHIPTGKLLSNSFNTGYGTTNTPKTIETAANLSCIILQSSQNDLFGGQSHPNFDNDLAPYVLSTRKIEITQVLFDRHLDKTATTQDCQLLLELVQVYGEKIVKWDFDRVLEEVSYLKIEDVDSWDYLNNLKSVIAKIEKSVEEGSYSLTTREKLKVEERVVRSVRQAMQSVICNLNTMHSRAGSQIPFSSLNIGLPKSEEAALICRLLLEEYKKGLGKGEQPIFPNIIFRLKKGVNRRGDKYYYLYKLACDVAAKRMNPTFMNMDASFNLRYYERGITPATMGCRTYLCSNVNGLEGPDARGNNACTTINLPRLAIYAVKTKQEQASTSADQAATIEYFFQRLTNMVHLAKDSLLHRYETLSKLKIRDVPFAMGQELMMGSEGLGPNDSIQPILKNGTWGIGFIGLAETLKILTGYHHGEKEESAELGERIVKTIRELCNVFTKELSLNFSCYATPAEGLSGHFTNLDVEKFGEIDWVTSKGFYTNSFHVPVDYLISAKRKLEIEAPYHALCNGGHISYVELDSYPTADVVEEIISGAYDTTDISCVSINFHIRYCTECGTYVDASNDTYTCPKCGCNKLQGISRVTGYLGLDERFGPGKVAERSARVAHSESNFGKNMYHIKSV